jgi:serine/threonine protein phosphatase PrpC
MAERRAHVFTFCCGVCSDRVNGCLAVSRAFADHALKSSGVSCVPYQQHVELTAAHKFLIIGCDGIWVSRGMAWSDTDSVCACECRTDALLLLVACLVPLRRM